MATFEVIDPAALPLVERYQAPFCTAQGPARSRFRAPDGFGQFVVYGDLDAGAELTWSDAVRPARHCE